MKPLYSKEEFDSVTSRTKLQCECEYCGNSFYALKGNIKLALNGSKHHKCNYCSKECASKAKINPETFISVSCTFCDKPIKKLFSASKRHKNYFCSHSCSTKYNNKHKTTGYRRSKLEIWLEGQLTNLYPNLEIHYNKTSAIESELDIYIPSLNVAFELNGIFHYEPIYGVNKLNQIQENDKSKSKACHEAKIDLCIIDTSGQKYVKPSTSQKYLDIILNIINSRIDNI